MECELYHIFFQTIMGFALRSRQCTYQRPKCLTEAPGNFSTPSTIFELSQPWCNDGKEIQAWAYNYKLCKLDNIDQFMAHDSLWCHCLESLFLHCTTFSNLSRCKNTFYFMACLQLLLIIVNLILNTIIVSVFKKRSSVRRSIPNILLCNQAIADLFNGGINGIISITYMIILMISKNVSYLCNTYILLCPIRAYRQACYCTH